MRRSVSIGAALAAVGFTLAVAGYGSAATYLDGIPAGPNSLDLKPAPLPRYTVGTKYVYSNGTWETVTRVDDDGVTWLNYRRRASRGLADFTFGRSQWETRTRNGIREFENATFLAVEPTTTLWPLEPGKVTRFEERGKWFSETGIDHRYTLYWSCEVQGTERVSVAAGDFSTWKITCRKKPNKFRATSKTREFRTWYYAPAVNHWVLEERDYNGYRKNRSKELVAILPDLKSFTASEDDIIAIKKAFQNSLEYGKSDDTTVYENFREQLVIGITPKKTFQHGDGRFCRQYWQVIAKEGVPYEYPGIACRNDEARWVVPRR